MSDEPIASRILATREEAATIAGVSPDRIDRWAIEPGFPVIRDGQLVRIHIRLFDQWLAARAEATNQRPPEIKINAPRTSPRRAS